MDLAALLDGDPPPAIDHHCVDVAAAREVTYVLRTDLTYEYPAPIRELRHRLVLVPRYRHGDQRCLAHRLTIDATEPAHARRRYDRFGNAIVDVMAPVVDRRITFSARAVIHRAAGESRHRPWRADHDRATHLTAPHVELLDAAAAIGPRHDGLDLAVAIGEAVRAAMTYRHDVTTVRTSAAEAWRGRAGVCQDFAHVMITMCRARGVPARYVSGHLLGEGASHAWVEVHDDETGRTIAYDPTHARPTTLRYITVAVGRDYRDVAPTAGSYGRGPRGTLHVRKGVALADVR